MNINDLKEHIMGIQPPKRRLPIFVLIDTTKGARDSFKKYLECCKHILSDLRNDPYALETAYLCLVSAGKQTTLLCNSSLDDTAIDTAIDSIRYEGGDCDFVRSLTDFHQIISGIYIRATYEKVVDRAPQIFILGDATIKDLPENIISFYRRYSTRYFTDNYSQYSEELRRIGTPFSYGEKIDLYYWVEAPISSGPSTQDIELPPPPEDADIII